MDRITALRIRRLTLWNFRNHTEPVAYDFGDLTYITGKNRAGKTTIAHAIAYALYGVNAFGEQNIDGLMNEHTHRTKVQMEFIDQNAEPHQLMRFRNDDQTELTLDSYTVRQKEIDMMFCDKDTFLSMFNPMYLAENMNSKDARNLITKYLKKVSVEEAIAALPGPLRDTLKNIELSFPEDTLRACKSELTYLKNQTLFTQGQLAAFRQEKEENSQKLGQLQKEFDGLKAKIDQLKQKQFEGIDVDEFNRQKELLEQQLVSLGHSDSEENTLKQKLYQAQNKRYEPTYQQPLAELAAQVKILADKYQSAREKYQKIKPGMRCPVCLTQITESNIEEVRGQIKNEIIDIAAKAEAIKKKQDELYGLEQKEKAIFEKSLSESIAQIGQQLTGLKKKEGPNRQEIQEMLFTIEEILRYGNLSVDEFHELSSLEAEQFKICADIKARKEIQYDEKLKDMINQQYQMESQMAQNTNIIDAIEKLLLKRAELAVAPIQMPNVKIKLNEVLRITGELRDVFKFLYQGRNFRYLSHSEKILAGIEIAAMMRNLTGLDCPVYVDDTESLEAFDSSIPMPQTLLLRFTSGQALSVRCQNHSQNFKQAA